MINVLKRLVPYIKKHIPLLLPGFFFLIIQNIGYLQIPLYIRKIIDEIASQNRFDVIVHYVIWTSLYTVILAISLFLMRKIIIGVSRKIEYMLREDIYKKILSLDYLFFMQNETGDITSRCTNDLNDVRTLLGPGIMYIPNSLTRFILFFPVLLGLNPLLMIIVSVLILIIILLILILMPRLRPLFKSIQESLGIINNSAWQIVSGITTVKLNTLEAIEYDRFSGINKQYIKKQLKLVKHREFIWPLLILIFSIAELCILLVGGMAVINKDLTIGELLQFSILITYLMFPVLSLGWVMSLIQQGISAMTRIDYILTRESVPHTRENNYKNDDISLEFVNLSYCYPGNDNCILHAINARIDSKNIVGLTGPIGSGKSTLLQIASGLLKPEPGMFFINGNDVTLGNPRLLFSIIAFVPQNTFLFSKTLAENIGLCETGTIDMERVRYTADLAGLSGDIRRFPEGYHQIIGERGINISGGQRQRIAIARALYKQSPVLILDDSFSSVDSGIEEIIVKNLLSAPWIKILIISSHRLSSLQNADMIYVMDDGRISEQGTHTSLLQGTGIYARLAAIQQLMENGENKLKPENSL
ncbi:MAG: ABC transporter ATP-binding protein [Spirochaetales bacterium]|nr:ABC transporter ATP-binding protein [Spirochaetales bacterium]